MAAAADHETQAAKDLPAQLQKRLWTTGQAPRHPAGKLYASKTDLRHGYWLNYQALFFLSAIEPCHHKQQQHGKTSYSQQEHQAF